jgi:hypothetical protein
MLLDNPFQVTAAGIFSSDVGTLLDVSYTTTFGPEGGGHDQATWTFAPNGRYVGKNFNPSAHVRIARNGATCWEGEFTGATPAGDGKVTMRARGYMHRVKDRDSIYYQSIDGDTDLAFPTNRLFFGLAPASDRKYGWEYAEQEFSPSIALPDDAEDLLSDSYGDTDAAGKAVKLSEVLSGRLQELGLYWQVWRRQMVFVEDSGLRSSPLVWTAPEGFVGIAAEDYRTRIGVWYMAAASMGSNELIEWVVDEDMDAEHGGPFDTKTDVVDFRGLGTITQARAQALGQGVLAQVRGRFIFDGSFAVADDSDFPLWAPKVRAGQAVRLTHLRTSMGTLIPEGENVFVIGDTDYRWSAEDNKGELRITPVGAVPRDLAAILKGEPKDQAGAIAPPAA